MIKFSLILNSRHRPQLLSNLLDSILFKTANIDEIEVLISADSDDNLTQSYFSKFNTTWGGFLPAFASIEYIQRERNLHKRLNNLASKIQGRYCWILNDDTEILTDNWDIIGWNILNNNFIDDVLYGRTQDNSCDSQGTYASFPFISNKAIKYLGFAMDERAWGLGGDVIAYRLFEGINRIIDLPIKINHILHQNIQQVNNPDLTCAEMREQTHIHCINPFTINIDNYIQILNEKLIDGKNI